MNYHIFSLSKKIKSGSGFVLFNFEDKTINKNNSLLTPSLQKSVQTFLEERKFQGKLKQALPLLRGFGVAEESIIVIGAGKEKNLSVDTYKTILSHVISATQNLGFKSLVLSLTDLPLPDRDAYWKVRLAIQALEDATYQFEAYKSHSRPQASLTDIYFHVDAEEESLAKAGIHDALILSKASHYARDLGNMPGNDCTPLYLAEEAKRIGKLKKVKCTVLDEKELKKQGLNALLAVGKGSVIPPRLIILEYKGAGRGTPPIALVGKGITFDTGGIGIKPWLGMPDMKMDMCGAATVLAVLEAAAENALPLNLVGIIPCAENMPSGSAYKPGDIIKTHAGITIEIRHTDAEGRVVLCDALSYVHRYKPRCIIDMATLTGAIIIALGHEYTGLMGNDPSLANELLKAGIESADPAWQLPINENFKKMVDSSIADIANHTDKTAAGSIMGACFLERFVKDVPWAHLDIAGTAMRSSASGRPVSLIMQYLWNQIKSGQ